MEEEDKLEIRADVAAEAHLAETLDRIYRGVPLPKRHFDDDEISALRATFKLGWLGGYKAAYKDFLSQLREMKERLDDE